MDLISSLTTDVVSKALDGLSKRHVAIASNLANVDTPGYHRQHVQFEEQLKQAIVKQTGQSQYSNQVVSNETELSMRATRAEHFSNAPASEVSTVQPQMTEDTDLMYRNDANSVDIEAEMAQLAKNTQRFIALSSLQSRTLKGLKSVINSSGGY